MSNIDPNKNNLFNTSDEGNKQSNRSTNEEKISSDENLEEAIPDLDGDGMIGNTGGFYGGTSYLGSNYTEEWSAAQNKESGNDGNLGAAGQSDLTDETDKTNKEKDQ